MESALSPREIQTRIRSGESVADVARVAGVDHERVERFAAPVIAEREHIAGLAMTSSVRRRGETSANRTLRHVLDERLLTRGVDIDSVGWDSYRLDDGRWAVTADYVTGETDHQAVFFFDVAGRYSVAGNDEGRWVLGDVAPGREPQAGQGDDDTEPTIDLSDELALVRAIQDFPPATGAGARETHVDVAYAEVVQLARTQRSAPEDPVEAVEPVEPVEAVEPDQPVEPVADEAVEDEGSGLDILSEIFSDQDPEADPGEAEPPTLVVETIYEETVLEVSTGEPGPGDEHLPSDASAVPELSPSLRSQAWEPAIVVDYPVEPSEERATSRCPRAATTPAAPSRPCRVRTVATRPSRWWMPSCSGTSARRRSLHPSLSPTARPRARCRRPGPRGSRTGGSRARDHRAGGAGAPARPARAARPGDPTQAGPAQARFGAELGRDRVRWSEGPVEELTT